ncbi:hypothetical protein ACFXPA_46570 [Amycolatopsis sp. NPDC059090]|uniref:hypothetical protein n=1 Tax=unclassified Amycolatopsis TaxID=2618356 RepID=UPI003671E0A5
MNRPVASDAPVADAEYLAEIMRVVDRHDAGECGAILTVDQIRDIIRDRRAHGRADVPAAS